MAWSHIQAKQKGKKSMRCGVGGYNLKKRLFIQKETLEQVFPSELSEIFTNYFVKPLRTAATVFCLFQVNKLIAIMLKDS